jgi:hypothetical protein
MRTEEGLHAYLACGTGVGRANIFKCEAIPRGRHDQKYTNDETYDRSHILRHGDVLLLN